MISVTIDAGHGGTDPGAVFQGRQEKNDTLLLAMQLGEILEENGVDVHYTRTSDVYDSPYEKAVSGNQAGSDYFISIHRNSNPTANSSSGIETLVYRDSGTAGNLARNIGANLEALGWNNRGVIERPGLVVLRRTTMPAVLVEAGFINNDQDNKKFDAELDATAQAIADGILETAGIRTVTTKPSSTTQEKSTNETYKTATPHRSASEKQLFYRVQVGAFRSRSIAESLANQLAEEGYPAFIIYEDELYKVQAGSFIRLENAIRMENRLRRNGYSTYITRAFV